MKRNFLFPAVAFFALTLNLSAANITQQDAQTVALNFFNLTTGNNQARTPLTATLQYTRTETDNTVDFYVFNMTPVTGFVIVSATDNDDPIIGYSTESIFRNDFGNVGVNNWLTRWSEELHYVILNNVVASPTAATKWADYRAGILPPAVKANGVGPLCKTTWDQNTEYSSGPNLYNNYCPGGSGANQAVTGCVATAMAQIMKYWNYPTTGIGSFEYDDATSAGYSKNYGVLSFNYGATTFNWADMPDSLTPNSSTAQIDAIGTLMYAAGVSVEMDYSPDGSGAFVLQAEAGGADSACAQYSYVHYFGYQSIIKGLLEGTGAGKVSSTALTDSIESELNAGRLVEVQGTDATYGGHTWVCDGYNTSNQLHMNWGWSGYSDGYYAITNMDPNDGDALNFSEDIGALIHILPPANTLTESATVGSSAICSGASTTLTAATHTNATYSWSPTTGLSCSTCASTNVTATATTIYTVTADSAGVIATASVTVNVNAPIVPAAGATTNVSCYGESNGSTSISATGGVGGYTYLWNGGQTSAGISNLAAGTYKVTITDSKGCTATASQTVTQPSVLAGTITPTDASCGASNGSASVTVTGGTATYSYHWNGGQSAATISNLAAGNYTVTITDAKGCTATANTTLTTTGGLSATLTATGASCYGSSTGSITASVSGGSGLTYAWSNGGSSATISNLAAGNYTVTISSSSGCSSTASQTVTQPASAVSASLTPVNASCNLANGSVSVSATGGTSGYSYVWSTGATSASVSGLGAGIYQVTVKDANSCSATASVTLTSSTGLNTAVTSTAVSCFNGSNGSVSVTVSGNSGNLTYAWSNGSSSAGLNNVPAGNYSATVSDANGCSASFSENVSQPSALNVSLTAAGAACGSPNGSITASVSGGTSGYTYAWSNSGGNTPSISSLSAGSYSLTVTDNNGCSTTAAAIVSNSGSLSLSPSIQGATCNGQNNGTATITAGNGTGPFRYSWSNGDQTSTISNLPAGSYNVTVTDNTGCSSSASISVTQPAPLVITTSFTDCTNGQDNGSASASNVSGGTGSYTYTWSNGGNTPTINNLAAGTYQLTVTDQNGCQIEASVVIGVTTGIGDLNNSVSFVMYPNPAATDVVVSVTKLNAETTISVKNILGQQLLSLSLNATQTHINVSDFANGVYLVELRQGDKSVVRQLIVNK